MFLGFLSFSAWACVDGTEGVNSFITHCDCKRYYRATSYHQKISSIEAEKILNHASFILEYNVGISLFDKIEPDYNIRKLHKVFDLDIFQSFLLDPHLNDILIGLQVFLKQTDQVTNKMSSESPKLLTKIRKKRQIAQDFVGLIKSNENQLTCRFREFLKICQDPSE